MARPLRKTPATRVPLAVRAERWTRYALDLGAAYDARERRLRAIVGGFLLALGLSLGAGLLTGCGAGGSLDWGIVKGIVQTACGAADVLIPAGDRTAGGEEEPIGHGELPPAEE